jgi:hypothetical protein
LGSFSFTAPAARSRTRTASLGCTSSTCSRAARVEAQVKARGRVLEPDRGRQDWCAMTGTGPKVPRLAGYWPCPARTWRGLHGG